MKKFLIFIIIEICLNFFNGIDIFCQKEDENFEFNIYFTEALRYEIKGEYNNALRIYLELKKAYPKKEIIDFRIANILYTFNDLKNSLNFATNAYKENKENRWYSLLLLELLQKNKKYDSAIIIGKEIIKKDKNPIIYEKLINIYLEANKKNFAKNLIKKGKKEFKEDYIFLLKEIEIEKNKKKKEKIISEAIKKYPDDNEIKFTFFKIKNDKSSLIKFLEDLVKYNEITNKIYEEIVKLKCENNDRDIEEYIIKNIVKNKNLNIIEKIEILKLNIDCIVKYENLKNFLKDSIEKYERNIVIFEILDLMIKLNEYEFTRKKVNELYNKYRDIKYLEYLFDIERDIKEKLKILEEIEKNKEKKDCRNKIIKINLLYQMQKYDENIEKIYEEIKYLCKNLYSENEKFLDYILAEYYRNINEYKKSDSIYLSLIKKYNDDNLIKNNYAYYKALRKENLDEIEKLSKETIINEKNNYHYLDTYAWILYEKGKIKKSKKYIRKAIRLMKKNNEENIEIIEHYKKIMKE